MMSTSGHPHAGHAEVNGTRLYYERRGTGPAFVFIPGGAVDADQFTQVATALADEFTAVTYDRRGYARSPRPHGWTVTTVAEQADDAAGLIESLGLAPATIWGGSLGGIILLDLLARYPELVRAAIIHEPPLFSVLDRGEVIADRLARQAADGMRADPRAAMEEHCRQSLGDTFERLTPSQRERLIAHAEVFLGVEVPALLACMPSAGTLASTLAGTKVSVQVLAGADAVGAPLHRASHWIADHVGTPLRELPGGHMPYATEPATTAAILRELAHTLTNT